MTRSSKGPKLTSKMTSAMQRFRTWIFAPPLGAPSLLARCSGPLSVLA
jgi:hypothetical protein